MLEVVLYIIFSLTLDSPFQHFSFSSSVCVSWQITELFLISVSYLIFLHFAECVINVCALASNKKAVTSLYFLFSGTFTCDLPWQGLLAIFEDSFPGFAEAESSEMSSKKPILVLP